MPEVVTPEFEPLVAPEPPGLPDAPAPPWLAPASSTEKAGSDPPLPPEHPNGAARHAKESARTQWWTAVMRPPTSQATYRARRARSKLRSAGMSGLFAGAEGMRTRRGDNRDATLTTAARHRERRSRPSTWTCFPPSLRLPPLVWARYGSNRRSWRIYLVTLRRQRQRLGAARPELCRHRAMRRDSRRRRCCTHRAPRARPHRQHPVPRRPVQRSLRA